METPLAGWKGSPLSPANPVSTELKSDPIKTRRARLPGRNETGAEAAKLRPVERPTLPPALNPPAARPPRRSELLKDIAAALQSPLPSPVRRRLPPL